MKSSHRFDRLLAFTSTALREMADTSASQGNELSKEQEAHLKTGQGNASLPPSQVSGQAGATEQNGQYPLTMKPESQPAELQPTNQSTVEAGTNLPQPVQPDTAQHLQGVPTVVMQPPEQGVQPETAQQLQGVQMGVVQPPTHSVPAGTVQQYPQGVPLGTAQPILIGYQPGGVYPPPTGTQVGGVQPVPVYQMQGVPANNGQPPPNYQPEGAPTGAVATMQVSCSKPASAIIDAPTMMQCRTCK